MSSSLQILLLLLLYKLDFSLQSVSSRSKQGGVGASTTYLCPSFNPSSWKYVDDSNNTYPITHNNGVSTSYDVLSISNIVPSHEGVYTCIEGGTEQGSMNLTVIAVPQFEGCQPARSCDLGTALTVQEGQPIPLNISIQYVNGGSRGIKQSLNIVRFRNPSRYSMIFCTDTNRCTIRNSRIGSYSHNINRDLSVNISNASLTDNGTYYAEIELVNPDNTAYISVITSTFTIAVTPTITVASTSAIKVPSSLTHTPSPTPSPSPSPSSTIKTPSLPSPSPTPSRPSYCDDKYTQVIFLCDNSSGVAIFNVKNNSVVFYSWEVDASTGICSDLSVKHTALKEFKKSSKSWCLNGSKYHGSTTQIRVKGLQARPLKKEKIEKCTNRCAAMVAKMLRPVNQSGCNKLAAV